MFVRVEEIIEQDEFQTQHGTLCGWKFRATDENGNECFLGINTKPGNALTPGTEFDFQPSGKVVGVYTLGKRAQPNNGGGYGGPQRGASRPATPAPRPGSAPSGPANAPQAPSQRPVPTMAQAVAVLKECVAAVEGWGEAAHATTLFLGRLRGDIRANPSAAEIEAAAKAKAAEAQRLADEAERARQAALAAQAQAAPAGYAPADAPGADDEIPFGFAIMAGAASLLSLIANGGIPGVA